MADDSASRLFRAPKSDGSAPPWWQSAVFYEIYIRSFQDSNNDGIGDLHGIEQRLPYLKSLGIDAIWITPFYNSPMADFGYDVSDYTNVDPSFGTLRDFDQMVRAAHALDLKVVIDFVPNHSSDQHPWFVESRSSRTNPKRDWYLWRDAKPDGSPPNNWTSFFGGSAWTWDEATGQYYLHMFLPQQPDLNWRNPELVQAMQDVLRFWLKRGTDGFRLDAIPFLIKHADFPDLPEVSNATGADLVAAQIYVNNQPEVHYILRGFRSVVDEHGGHPVLIGETGALKAHELAQFYGDTLDELQLPMIVLPLHSPWHATSMRETLIAFYSKIPEGATAHLVFGNHDDPRLITRYGVEHHRTIGMLLLTLLGSPILYYGDEIGMVNADIPPERRVDPAGMRDPEGYAGRDPERTPMQWTADRQAGFTADHVEPWLPVHENHAIVNVVAQEQKPYSTLHFYRDLLSIRRQQSSALREGDIRFLSLGGDDVLAYTRETETERLMVLLNLSGNPQQLNLSAWGEKVSQFFSTQPRDAVSLDAVTLAPYEGLLLNL